MYISSKSHFPKYVVVHYAYNNNLAEDKICWLYSLLVPKAELVINFSLHTQLIPKKLKIANPSEG